VGRLRFKVSLVKKLVKLQTKNQALVAQACNPSYSGDLIGR
jgi:hypothetical protein